MKRVFLLFVFFHIFQISKAQYTEIINSKRPGFSESPYGIGTGVYQVESGLFFKDSNHKAPLANTKSFGGELFLRYARFSEKLEFNAHIAYQKDEFNHEFESNFKTNGISKITIGGKYLIYQQNYKDKSKEIRSWKRKMAFDKKRLIPSVGVYAGVNTNFIGKDYKSDEGISFKGAILLQNDFTDRLVLLTNLIADKISTEEQYYSYIVTMTYAINERWSYFIENQGNIYEELAPEQQFGTGIAYLLSPNLQIDASARTNFFDNYSYLYLTAGFSWRLDRHQDSFIYKNQPKQPSKKRSKRKGFFGRLFSKKRN
ncbi:transporter [Lutibacter aestuarii]|uniref:Transporter n=1 Tax=Lutibacter aestuarii TaxID=861111 RepID=A0ABW2Z8S9_9FLAO|nr:transporter [uncultured Lutibacter sp.]